MCTEYVIIKLLIANLCKRERDLCIIYKERKRRNLTTPSTVGACAVHYEYYISHVTE